MTLYENLLKQKEQGNTISLRDLGYDELYTLWIVENIYDRQIADLCNCLQKSVANKRCRLGINFFMKCRYDIMTTIGEL